MKTAERDTGLLGDDRAEVFYDGTLTDPQLDHPEGLAVHPDGSVWCGGERGQVYRLDPDGTSLEQVASTGGFCLGMAFDRDANLFVCDLKHKAVFRVETRTGRVERFADGGPGRAFSIPNYPAFDAEGRLYVSDSHGFRDPGPGIFRVEPDGTGRLWFDGTMNFANGIAVSPGGGFVYASETFGYTVSRVAVRDDGSAGEREVVAVLPGWLPDGLAFDADGRLYVGCYEPSQVVRVDPDGAVHVVYRDWEAHTLCHPTNLAFRGTDLFTANLGRWHLTRIDVGVRGLPLPPGSAA